MLYPVCFQGDISVIFAETFWSFVSQLY